MSSQVQPKTSRFDEAKEARFDEEAAEWGLEARQGQRREDGNEMTSLDP